jgi:hypothetical protein
MDYLLLINGLYGNKRYWTNNRKNNVEGEDFRHLFRMHWLPAYRKIYKHKFTYVFLDCGNIFFKMQFCHCTNIIKWIHRNSSTKSLGDIILCDHSHIWSTIVQNIVMQHKTAVGKAWPWKPECHLPRFSSQN